jgi:hypothetical protein
MSSVCPLTIAMDFNGPPGITHPLLEEKYAWVDQRLEELYYSYALTEENYNEYQDAGLLSEEDADDYLPRPAPLTWVSYRSYPEQYSLEEIYEKRDRAESDVSDHEDDVKRALHMLNSRPHLSDASFEMIDIESDFDKFSEICCASDSSTPIDVDFELDFDNCDLF